MKAVVIPLKPHEIKQIISGEKTLILQKRIPSVSLPYKCYIYCSKDKESNLFLKQGNKFLGYKETDVSGMIVAEFICDATEQYEAEFVDGDYYESIKKVYYDEDWEDEAYTHITSNDEDNPDDCYLCKQSCMTFTEIKKYVGIGCSQNFYSLHISEPRILEEPRRFKRITRWQYISE